MSDLPKISIVMPSLNQARFLRQAMESVLDQGYSGLEFIVVDGGSTDDSLSIIRSMESHLAWWTSEEDAGQAAAVNKGFARATGQVFGWLNSDDYYLEGALHKVADAHGRNPTAGLLVGNGLRVDERGKRIDLFSRAPIAIDQYTLAHGVDYLLQPSTFFSRAAWERVGGLREDLEWCLDWDLWIRISKEYPAEVIDGLLAVGREHSATKTAAGGFERWTEIRRLTESHTGMQLTPGALAYFLHTLHDYLQSDRRAIRCMSGLRPITARYWERVSKICLEPLTGRVAPGPDVRKLGDERQRTREILDSLRNEIAQERHAELDELAGHVNNLQVRLQELERHLLVRAGKALRLI